MRKLNLLSAAASVACCLYSFGATAATVSLTELDWFTKDGAADVNAPLTNNTIADSFTGVYNSVVIGNQLPNARSPYDFNNDGNANAAYSVISFGGTGAGTATYNLGGATTVFFLWGSPDNYNFVRFYDSGGNLLDTAGANSAYFTGTDLPACGSICDQLHWDLVAFNSTTAIDHMVLSDDGTAAFEYGLSLSPPVSNVPLPAALPLFATGLGALGFAGWRKRKKAKTA